MHGLVIRWLRLSGGLLVIWAAPVLAAWQPVGEVTEVHANSTLAELTTSSGARVELTFVTADTVRVRLSPGGTFGDDVSYALVSPPAASMAIRLTESADRIDITPAVRAGARIVVQKKPALAIAVYDAAGNLVNTDDPHRPTLFDRDTGAFETSKARDASEFYYGFGEQALPMSRDQQTVVMWNTDAGQYPVGSTALYQAIPFFIALRNGKAYGVFFDNTWRSYFDMGQRDPQRYTFGAAGGELNYYVFTGGTERSPARVLRDYTALTGRGPLPPLWALGYQQSRYSYTPQSKVQDVARTFREKKIPADVIYLDIDYMEGYRIFTWSAQNFPQPTAMLAELKSEGFHAVTIVDPGVKADEGYDVYRSGREHGVFVRDAQGGELHASVWPGVCAFPDFTDPRARSWWGALYAKPLGEGVSGFWNDMNEPAVFRPGDATGAQALHAPDKTFALDVRHAGDGRPGTHAQYHNVFGMQMARATFEGLHSLRPDVRPFVLTRAGYAGVQRYAAVWSGDNVASWDHLALTIPLLTNLSVSGVPFVGADVGGFAKTPSAELYTRWLQAAVLTPFFRTHSAIDTEPREPWSYGPGFERINRETIELRYRLLPYIYTLFAQQETTGAPLLRPLWFDYPQDARVALTDDEYLLGRDLLVAPVLRPGAIRRNVDFPLGDDWIDWWDGTRHAGGSHADIAAPIDRLPLFVRVGAAVPTQPVIQQTGEMNTAPLTIAVALGAPMSGVVFQDDGEGYGYRRGASRTINVESLPAGVRLNIPAANGFQHVAAVEFIGVDAAPSAVTIDGTAARNIVFDAPTRRLRVALPSERARVIALKP